jgi:hypothetical protein
MRSHLDGWAGTVVDIQEKTKEVSPHSQFSFSPIMT